MIKQISNAEYQSLEAISFSGMKQFIKSPLHYRIYKTSTPKPSTSAQILGTAVHSAILEPELFTTTYRVIDADKRTKAGKEAHEMLAMSGLIGISSEVYEIASRAREVVFKHKILKDLFYGGIAESSVIAEDSQTGTLLKCRPDYFNESAGICLDVKTFDDLSEKAIRKQVYSQAYDLQAIHYLRTLSEYLGKPLRLHGLVFIEPNVDVLKNGSGVVIAELSDSSKERAYEYYDYVNNLIKYKECFDSNEWPGYSTDPIQLNLA